MKCWLGTECAGVFSSGSRQDTFLTGPMAASLVGVKWCLVFLINKVSRVFSSWIRLLDTTWGFCCLQSIHPRGWWEVLGRPGTGTQHRVPAHPLQTVDSIEEEAEEAKISLEAPQLLMVSFPLCATVVLYLTLCSPVDCSPPGSSVHGIFQARILD